MKKSSSANFMKRCIRSLASLLLPAAFAIASFSVHAAPLKIGYSDWPGWVAFQVAIDKGWFKEAGVDVKFEWFDYSASMEAFAAGKLDAVMMTNGDALVTGSGGGKSVMVLVTDYSNGNDVIVGKGPIKSLKDLKGKKVAVESGLVEHLMLLNALKKSGLKESDVTLVNAKTNEMPQMLGSPDIAAVGCWQPIVNQALKAVPGSHPLYTSADEPGLIYDVVAATPTSAKARKADWVKVMKVWDKVVAYIEDPKTQPDAVKIMAARSGVSSAEYLPLLKGTKLLSLAEGSKVYVKGTGFTSLYGSTKFVDTFNVANAVYKTPEKIESYLDPSFTAAALK
jgi:NitT/TauT family transport system substrate-binding protein